MRRTSARKLAIETLESREMLSADGQILGGGSSSLMTDNSAAAVSSESIPAATTLSSAAVVDLPGDYNLDGRVTFNDLTPICRTLGQNVPSNTGADGNGNGVIDFGDFSVWLSHLGQKSTTIIQEPPHMENFPDFAASPTISAVGSGSWSDPATWGGRVPAAVDVAVIPANLVVSINDTSAVVDRLVVHGTLQFATDHDTQLRVSTLLVHEDGSLIIGTEDAPVTANAKIIIRDTPIDLSLDPEQYGTGLLVEGTIRIHGLAKTSFERLAVEPLAGATSLKFAAPVSGWLPGDRLFLADTRQSGGGVDPLNDPHAEIAVIESVSADGLTVTLTAPLAFDHLGARDGDGVLTILPHAANLSRNVAIASENPDGTRGHTMYTGRADVDIRYAEFDDLGRTTSAPLDSTTFNTDGTVAHIGTNQIGRYSIHLHHLNGPVQGQADGYQYTVVGTVSNGGMEMHDFKWGLAIHDSHYGLVQDNIITGWSGAGLVTEQGNESFNVIEHNFAARIWGPGGRLDAALAMEGAQGNAFWLRGVNNYVRGNVAANVIDTSTQTVIQAFQLFNANVNSTTGVLIPAKPGSEARIKVDPFQQPILDFSNNEAYGTTSIGFEFWSIGAAGASAGEYNNGTPESSVRNFVSWHHSYAGIRVYPSEHVDFDGMTLLGDYFRFRDNVDPALLGLTSGDYTDAGVIITHANIQNHTFGMSLGTVSQNQPQTIRDSYLRNQTGMFVRTPYYSGLPQFITPLETHIDNVIFAVPSVPPLNRQWLSIDMTYLASLSANLVQRDEVFVTNYNGVAGDNFRLYYVEQEPDFVVPQTNPNYIGAPEAGLTNQQNWDRYGIAIAGSLVPSSAVERDGIHGLLVATP